MIFIKNAKSILMILINTLRRSHLTYRNMDADQEAHAEMYESVISAMEKTKSKIEKIVKEL